MLITEISAMILVRNFCIKLLQYNNATNVPKEDDGCVVARYRYYHYTEYFDKFDEISALISRNAVYSGDYDMFFDEQLQTGGNQKQQVDELFLKQVNQWRISLSNELYQKRPRQYTLDVLNDVVQEFHSKPYPDCVRVKHIEKSKNCELLTLLETKIWTRCCPSPDRK